MRQSSVGSVDRFPGESGCRPFLVMGTRLEAARMASIVLESRRRAGVEPLVCFTGQRREGWRETAEQLGVLPDLDLGVTEDDRTRAGLAAKCVERLDEAIGRFAPGCVVAPGEGTTALAASLVAACRELPFIQIGSGLRDNTGEPAVSGRGVFLDRSAALHCVASRKAAENLRAEGVAPDVIEVTGSTAVDALLRECERLPHDGPRWSGLHEDLGDRRLAVVVAELRDGLAGRLAASCRALERLANRFTDTTFVFAADGEAVARESARRFLRGLPNVQLLESWSYSELVWLLDRATLVLTDSHGVSEESECLGKPTLELSEASVRQLFTTGRFPHSAKRHKADMDGESGERVMNLLERRAWRRQRLLRLAA